jgi:beta-glucosidase-like glycosyl hydrolase
MSPFKFLSASLLASASLFASWPEETLEKMSIDEKIGQLFVVPACPLRGQDHLDDLQKMFSEYHVGGVILKQGDPMGQVTLINSMQSKSKIPLLTLMDAEWGLSMRLNHTVRFPKNLTLGAIQDNHFIFELGKEIGRECKLVGAHVNLSPVVDVNNNPNNPIIHMRSFGQDPNNVAEKAIQYMEGMQQQGVLACAKHFPGHGDTAIDSHLTLPLISHSFAHLDLIELYPFKKMIEKNIAAIMTAHLFLPCLDGKYPSSISNFVVEDLLQKKLGFEGLVITDALNMKALKSNFSVEEVAIKALTSGSDLLVYGDHIAPYIDEILKVDIPKAFAALKKAYINGEIDDAMIDRHVLKILKTKESLNLQSFTQLADPDLEELNSKEAILLKRELYRQAITLLENKKTLLPLKPKKAALLHIGEQKNFYHALSAYAKIESYSFAERSKLLEKGTLPIIVALYDVEMNAKEGARISNEVKGFLEELRKTPFPVILVLFGTPYALAELPSFPTVIVAYEDDVDAEEAAADLIFGTLQPKGKLPVGVSKLHPLGKGL